MSLLLLLLLLLVGSKNASCCLLSTCDVSKLVVLPWAQCVLHLSRASRGAKRFRWGYVRRRLDPSPPQPILTFHFAELIVFPSFQRGPWAVWRPPSRSISSPHLFLKKISPLNKQAAGVLAEVIAKRAWARPKVRWSAIILALIFFVWFDKPSPNIHT